jgi:Rps23 Pro-64 3,4-dihydroxylase Tpa1-like proline 4-hydroxylase
MPNIAPCSPFLSTMVQTAEQFINLEYWESQLAELTKRYNTEDPFPHIVIDDFLQPEVLEKARQEFPPVGDQGWIHYLHYNEKKHGLNKIDLIPPYNRALIEELNSSRFIAFLEKLTGIKGLKPDPSLEGGGLHQSVRGGFLNIHADFTVHPHQRHWQRRVNVLVYLNKDWKEEYNGHLELWTRDMKERRQRVSPVFNRCVIFNTDFNSYHGVPDPILCPEGDSRKSVALYYFTQEANPRKIGTNYQPRPDESPAKKLFVFFDKQVLWTYNRLKGLLGINDDFASKVLGMFGKKK